MAETAGGAAVVARIKEGGRRVEEVTSRGIGHRFRIEILAALHEGPANTTQLARILRQPHSKVWNHVQELLKDGSIEEAFATEERNHKITYYRVVELPFFSEQAVREMTPEERQITAALILQSSAAEALAALWAGKLAHDPKVMLAWNRIVLDRKGREDLCDEQARNWDRMEEIAAESANRRAKTGEAGVMHIITSYGYERARSTPPEPVEGDIPMPSRES
ncbi:MAG TPA: winged helix-turn-helix domain-containing protein [Solirubrobacterales bacterium]|nr:winged helix-turn-helix domain-containing protein [Solirubrobacterales bacterium]